MPIEFGCPQCARVLRVSDEHAGKTARCPDCQTIMNIPSAASATAAPAPRYGVAGLESPVPQQTTPPYPGKATQGASFPATRAAKSDGRWAPQSVAIGEIFDYAWRAFKAHAGLLIGVTILIIGFSMVIAVMQFMIEGPPNRQPTLGQQLLSLGCGFFGSLVGIFLGIGQIRINCDIARKGQAEFATLFSGGDRFLPAVGASILAGLAVGLGLAMLVIPGLILLVLFWSYLYFIADRQTAALDSFSAALEIGKINIGTTVMLALISLVLSILGVLALGVGLLLAAPLISLMWSVAYLKMTRQI